MNERKLWFGAKRFGWGWTPITWQGWVSTFLYIGILFLEFRGVGFGMRSGQDTLLGFPVSFILVTALFLFLTWGTGERPRWNWGGKI